MSAEAKNQKGKKNNKKGPDRFKAEEPFVNETPEGALKDFSKPIANAYNPPAVEAAWNKYWEKQGYYQPSGDGEPYVMVLPPPNVTGSLHLGHALTVAVEDAIMRYQRMNGRKVLWVPGIDHAGIATQVVVEKKIMREQQKTRHDLGREAFLEEVWKWKAVNGDKINTQLQSLGASLDWTRAVFTMDEQCNIAVNEAFVRMYENKKIYRSNRLVQWSCALRSAISSIEVDHKEFAGATMVSVPGYEEKVEFGVIHSFAYKLASDPERELVVATTRIETMLGDVAVAVHPDDDRYKELIGQKLIHPFVPDREVTVVADPVLVDMAFGTGAVKVTPGHDPNDFECGVRNNLPFISILDPAGCINKNGGEEFNGMPRFTARTAVIEALDKKGLYRGKAPNPMSVGFCSRSKDVLEPVLRPQWYVDCKEMAARSVEAVKKKELNIMPVTHEKTWFNWLENIQEWCISRQLWWGHRIPAYQVEIDGVTQKNEDGESPWVVGRTKEDALKKAQDMYPDADVKSITLSQDPDVLDTWFSSGLFPFSTMKWPQETDDLKEFYPGHLLETGHDILFFWVARMVMMSLELNDKLPFTNVYLHAMVRDKIGRKMSKSRGNVVDPLDVISGISIDELQDKLKRGNLDPKELKIASANQKQEFGNGISQCGADALRYGLLSCTVQGRDINLDINEVVAKREFCNKLWNAVKFALLYFEGNDVSTKGVADTVEIVKAGGSTFRDTWMLHRLARAVTKVNAHFQAFEFGEACTVIHKFWLQELCSMYLEMVKPVLYAKDPATSKSILAVLHTCLTEGLKLLHPLMPFVTEELYHRLPGWTQETAGDLIVAPFPKSEDFEPLINTALDDQMTLLRAMVDEARSMRSSLNLTKTKVDLHIRIQEPKVRAYFDAMQLDVKTLTSSKDTFLLDADAKQPAGCVSKTIVQGVDAFFNLEGLPELAQEVVKREKQEKTLNTKVQSLSITVNRPDFAKAKPEMQTKIRGELAEFEAQLATLVESITQLKTLMTPPQMENYFIGKKSAYETELKKLEATSAKTVAQLEKKPKNKKALKLLETTKGQVTAVQEQMKALEETMAEFKLSQQ